MVKTFLTVIAFLLSGIIIGCAPQKWVASTTKQYEIQWPPPPNALKVEYLGELNAFREQGQSLLSLLTGKSNKGRLLKPVALAVGHDERMAVSDMERMGVHFYIPADKKYLFISKTKDKQIKSPVSVIFDDNLRLYISDSFHRAIFIYNRDGKFVNELKNFGKNSFNQPKNIPFGRPTGLTYYQLDALLYVADTTRNQIHIFNDKSEFLKSFGNPGDKNGEFNFPTHLTVNQQGDILVNDAMNFRVQLLNSEGKFLSLFGHHGDGSGDFAMPKGIAIDKWNVIYVVDALFDAVQLFDQQGNFLLTIGSKGANPGEFWLPSGIFIDHNDKLYVCDTYNQRIQLFQLYRGIAVGGAQ